VERQEGVDAGTKDSSTRPRHRLRWLTLLESVTHLDLPERRRLVHALVKDLTIIAAYPFCRFNTRKDDGAWELLAQGWSRMLAHHPGHDLEGAMEQAGWRPASLSTTSPSVSSTTLVADGLTESEETWSAENRAPFPKSGNNNDPIIIRAGTTWIRERQVQEDVGEPIRLRLQLSWIPPLPPPSLPTTVEGSQP